MTTRVLALLSAFFLLLSLSACGDKKALPIRVDIPAPIKNLDPQFATEGTAQTIIANTFEGLVRKDLDGKIIPAVAESFDVSPDLKTYTFYLRKDVLWENDTPVTAHDFVFAFQRMFHPQVPSPFAQQYIMIENAPQIMSGELPNTLLGVKAKDDYTLVFTLSKASPLFLERLCEPPASPCNEEFFNGTRARYGLGKSYIMSNGVFTLNSWNNEKSIVIRRNEKYYDYNTEKSDSVYFYIGRTIKEKSHEESKKELFEVGKSDIFAATSKQMESLFSLDVSYTENESKSWQLIFNQKNKYLANENFRKALVMSIDTKEFRSLIPEMYRLSFGLIPPAARGVEISRPRLMNYSTSEALQCYEEAMHELEMNQVKNLTILASQDAGLNNLLGYIQKQWLDKLSIYINLEIVPEEEFNSRINSGNYTLAIVSMHAGESGAENFLESFKTGSAYNYSNFSNVEYDAILTAVTQAIQPKNRFLLFEQAEQFLINSAVSMPLFTQSEYYVFHTSTTGIDFINNKPMFRNAKRLD